MNDQPLEAYRQPEGAAAEPTPVSHGLLSLGLGVTLLLLAGLCWNTYDSYRESRMLSARLTKLQALRGIMVHSDEELSMSAAVFAATGDPRWEQRYRASERALQGALDEVRALMAETGDEVPLREIDGVRILLGQIDLRAKQLGVSAAERNAPAVFPGEIYGELKRLYIEGTKKMDDQLRLASESTLERAASHSRLHILFLLGLLPVLGGVWLHMLRVLHQTRSAMKVARRELEGVVEERERFLSRMSHALRSPLTSVLGYTDLLLDTDLSDEERAEYLGVVRRNGEDVLTILGDLLDLAQLQTGKGSFEFIEISPFEIVDEVWRFTRDQAAERSLDFVVEYQGKLPTKISTDLERVRQVLVTLVSNAIQFTESGGIRIVSRLLEDKNGRHALEFKAIDTGIGMTPVQLREVFDAYSRVGKSPRCSSGGTGLGLAISRELARRLGGDLTLESAPGKGTCVTFTIDVGTLEGVELVEGAVLSTSSEHASSTARPETIGGLRGRLLVAEDTEDVRHFLESVLRQVGFEVETAENGEIAYQKSVAAWDAGQPFDVVLMDMQMPILSGLDATGRLRERGYTSPIIALTSHALKGDREMCIQGGCDGYTTKPIDRQHLLTTIAQHLPKGEELD